MKEGDVVRHRFSQTNYLVERLTPKKAEVRQYLADGTLSSGTVMVLRRNLVVVRKKNEEVR